jgi:hypothetical protein
VTQPPVTRQSLVLSLSAFELGQWVHAELVGHPAFEITAPNDAVGTLTVYLTYGDADLRSDCNADMATALSGSHASARAERRIRFGL